jgi:hypothetical protein
MGSFLQKIQNTNAPCAAGPLDSPSGPRDVARWWGADDRLSSVPGTNKSCIRCRNVDDEDYISDESFDDLSFCDCLSEAVKEGCDMQLVEGENQFQAGEFRLQDVKRD